MTHTQDVLLLLAAIRENPDEDTLRLELADALQESGDEARAELVRVQVELARDDAEDAANNRMGTNPLRSRVAQLLRDNPHWLTKPCPECGGCGKIKEAQFPPQSFRSIREAQMATQISFTITESDCPICNGTCDLFKQVTRNTVIVRRGDPFPGDSIARLDRGLVRVSAPPERLWKTCPKCGGNGNHGGYTSDMNPGSCDRCKGTGAVPHPWLTAIAADPFVVYVDVEVKKPYHNGAGYCWYQPDRNRKSAPDSAELPADLWSTLVGWITKRSSRRYRAYLTEAAAMHALSVALLRWAKGKKE